MFLMKLKRIRISNFRSIDSEHFEVIEKGGSYTYTFIGENESGKSNFLRALSLYDDGTPSFPADYHDPKKSIEISFFYTLDSAEEKELRQALINKDSEKSAVAQIVVTEVEITSSFDSKLPISRSRTENLSFKEEVLPMFTLRDGKAEMKTDPSERSLDLHELFDATLPSYFWKISHVATIWKADSSHLINEAIDLAAFAADPDGISVPLSNCFNLAGLEDIPGTVAALVDNPAAIKNLQDMLEDKVTAHIRRVWPDHPIKIKFQINNNAISFLIEDDKVKYQAKTIQQRSDGFRQFISFLLTLSAESATDRLSNTLLLLDEPETFLHPQAQEHLRGELIRITSNKENNIVFFATHSNYMIDKEMLDRCYRVSKKGNRTTKWEMIPGKGVSYAQVNYEVFNLPSTDYHNELYGYIEDVDPAALAGLATPMTWTNIKTGYTEAVSLPKYIRHSIHHPENTKNSKFTPEDLVKSIEMLRKLKT